MRTIAILGATSQIAQDFIRRQDGIALVLFSRQPDMVSKWLAEENRPVFPSWEYARFGEGTYDAVINFIGSGDPARTHAMGEGIFKVTQHYDELALDYLDRRPGTRYIFISSGAAYGSTFQEPARDNTPAIVPINALAQQDFYSVAKLYAEVRHRAAHTSSIVDIRIFNYFSRYTNIAKRFFITDMLRAIRDRAAFETNDQSMRRDFIGPEDFSTLVNAALSAPTVNIAIDAYSGAPVEKFELLRAMTKNFGLIVKITQAPDIVAATGAKPNYYSLSRRAADFGYKPAFTSLESLIHESRALLEGID